ncbi:MAG: AAA family ATPase [Pseudomonadota bacterium]
MLLVLAGLPASGKSTLARGIARALGATCLRIDSIEQALRDASQIDVQVEGYAAAYAIAADNLALGLTVVADSVNPINVTRAAWRAVGQAAAVPVVELEVICSDRDEHRRRVESRATDVPNLVLPAWQDVIHRDYEPWDRARIVIDTAGESSSESLARALSQIREQLA